MKGRGIGDRFLGACRALRRAASSGGWHLRDVAEDYRTVLGELEAYGGGLIEKPRLVALKQDRRARRRKSRCRKGCRRCARQVSQDAAAAVGGNHRCRGSLRGLRDTIAGLIRGARKTQHAEDEAWTPLKPLPWPARKRPPCPPTRHRCRRIVVKIGSALLVDPRDRRAAPAAGLTGSMADVADDAKRRGQEVLLVSSGADCAGAPGAGPASAGCWRWSRRRRQRRWARSGSHSAYEAALEPHGVEPRRYC
jgi:hypothetical protein